MKIISFRMFYENEIRCKSNINYENKPFPESSLRADKQRWISKILTRNESQTEIEFANRM